MELHISSRLIGSDLGLTVDDVSGTSTFDSGAPTTWTVGNMNAQYSVEMLAAVSGIQANLQPPDAFVQAQQEVGISPTMTPWHWVLPPEVFRQYIRDILEASRDVLDRGVVEYYSSVFRAARNCLDRLERAAIDEPELDVRLRQEGTQGQCRVLRSFAPEPDGLARPVTYCQVSSRTGRLVVRDGPQILTLRRNLRGILRSRYSGGIILQVDFVSLEARIAGLLGGVIPERDVYAQVARDVLGGRHSRAAAKLASLSVLYGAGPQRLASQLGVERDEAVGIIEEVSGFFGAATRARSLVKEAVHRGCISNFYGRVLPADDKSSHVLYNNFIQSTGVDVAMLGFNWIMDRLGNRIHPLFVLHDALILDVHPDRMTHIADLAGGTVPVDGFLGSFYIDVSEF